MLTLSYTIPTLPPRADLETLAIMKALVGAKSALALVKGSALSVPNQGILIDTLALQEAQASSAIENIVTTQDDIYRRDTQIDLTFGPAKEVTLYRDALRLGYHSMLSAQGLITNGHLVAMFQLLKQRSDGFRRQAGTALLNDQTGQLIYVPPQDSGQISAMMADLERFINDSADCALDPLIKMALIHHQFESIHPFPDGNGRLGRILNVLYLTRMGLLDIPILYLSRYINHNKARYYHLLQAVREEGVWEDWVIFMLNGVEETSTVTLGLLTGIRTQMAQYKHVMKTDHRKIYSQDLLNNLFRHPYTRIEYVMRDLGVSRPTASKYLEQLTGANLLRKVGAGRDNYYVNAPLVDLFDRAARPYSP